MHPLQFQAPVRPVRGIPLLILPVLAAAVAAAGEPAADPAVDPAASGLRERVIAAAPAHRTRARAYRYQETVTPYEYRGDRDWEPAPSRTYRIFPIDSYLYRRLLDVGGVPLSEAQERREESREEEFRRQLEKDRVPDDSRWRKMIPLEDFVDNYEYRIVGTESIGGRPATVLEFRPGEWKKDLLGRLDRIFRNLEGRVWIDQQDFQVVRVEGHLQTGIRWGFGLVATLNTFELEIEQKKVDDQVWLPDTVSYQAEGSAFILGRIHRRNVSRFHDFQRVDSLVPATAAAHARKAGDDPD